MFTRNRWRGLARVVLFAPLLATAPLGAQTVDTRTGWNRGGVTIPAFGQTFTVPAGAGTLVEFTFWIATNGSAAPMPSTYEAYIMRWSGAAPVGDVLFQSGVQQAPDCCPTSAVLFNTSALPVLEGEQYVAFLASFSGSLVYLRTTDHTGEPVNSYAGGSAVFTHSCGAALATCSWASTLPAQDMDFVATFGRPVDVPEPGALPLLLLGVVLALAARARYRTRFITTVAIACVTASTADAQATTATAANGRVRTAVIEFTPTANATSMTAEAKRQLQASLAFSLVESKRFDVVDVRRTREASQQMLSAINHDSSTAAAVAVGRQLGVSHVLTGAVTEYTATGDGGFGYATLRARLVEVATGAVTYAGETAQKGTSAMRTTGATEMQTKVLKPAIERLTAALVAAP